MADYPPPSAELLEACLAAFRDNRHQIGVFGSSVREFLSSHPKLTEGNLPSIHSVKYRIKSEEHLREKIVRKKVDENRVITPETLFSEVTDLVGVRVLHLHNEQFSQIHSCIINQCNDGHWSLDEKPMAYTWDPEASKFFHDLGLETAIKDSHYTSVHYVVKPNRSLPISCEIQVRTLFEEVWGEIDHVLNYPQPTKSVACREQIRVLAKIVGAGTRLAEAIFRSHAEFSKK